MSVFSVSFQVMVVVFVLSANPLFCVFWLIGFQYFTWFVWHLGVDPFLFVTLTVSPFAMKRNEQTKKDEYRFRPTSWICALGNIGDDVGHKAKREIHVKTKQRT